MKKHWGKRFAAAALSVLLLVGAAVIPASAASQPKQYMNVGYAFRRGLVVEDLDLSRITHLNYSFGLLYNRETPPDPSQELNPDCQTPAVFDDSLLHTIYLPEDAKRDLEKLPALKAQKNPNLKLMLSVGGYNARGFSDMASTDAGRKAFAKSCRDVIDTYHLDGIDIDWEYPTIDWANIRVRKEDPQNFTLMLQEVRKAIGDDKLLSIAGSANVNFSSEWTEFKKVIDLLDYINIMTYDFQYGTCYYGSALYASKRWPTKNAEDEYNADMAIQRYIQMGCPAEKINMGLAYAVITMPEALRDDSFDAVVKKNLEASGFYSDEAQKLPSLRRVKDYLENKSYPQADGSVIRFDKKWDADACMSYIATYDKAGNEKFVLSYIEPQGLAAKTDYVKEHGLGGTMFWEFGSDYDNLLTTQIARDFGIISQTGIPASVVTPAAAVKTYTVRSGDTLSGIAKQNGMTLNKLAELNPQIKNINLLSIGQSIKLA